MKTFTIGDVADAIEKNGLPQTYGYYFKSQLEFEGGEEGFNDPESYIKIAAACAMGQACINLEVIPEWISDDKVHWPLIDAIISLNDGQDKSFKEIADYIRSHYDVGKTIQADEFHYITQGVES